MEEIAKRRAIDRMAARVTQPGPKYAALKPLKGNPVNPDQDVPFEMSDPPCSLENLVGVRRGSLTVVGYATWRGTSKSESPHRWCCRCVCGRYTLRKGKALRNERNTTDACDRCRELHFLKRQQKQIDGGEYVPATRFTVAAAPKAS